jgi:PRTRC genetic system ThiF family protein
MAIHQLSAELLTREVRVSVIGAGGTGSQMLMGLAQLHTAMIALGHPGGLDVTVIDSDQVSEANVGRQMFYPSDVGLPKASVLVNRINMAMGTGWKADVRRLNASESLRTDLAIGCVDNRLARKAILDSVAHGGGGYWLDLGNRLHDGQVVLGQVPARWAKPNAERLPHAVDLLPEIADASQEADDDTPSCSLADALEKQSLFVNRGVSLYALNLLWELFRYGQIGYHGVFVNLKNARTTPLPVDPEAWARFGYPKPKRSRKRRGKGG